jgi:CRP-like cAMP-binding protein
MGLKLPRITEKNLVERVAASEQTGIDSVIDNQIPEEAVEKVEKKERRKKRHRHKHCHHHHRKNPESQMETTEPKVLMVPEATIQMIESTQIEADELPEMQYDSQEFSSAPITIIEERTVSMESMADKEETGEIPWAASEEKTSKLRPALAPINTSNLRRKTFRMQRKGTFYHANPENTLSIDGHAVTEAVKARSDRCCVSWNYALFAVCQQNRLKSIPNMSKTQPFVNIAYHVSDNEWYSMSGKLLRTVAQGFDLNDVLITFQQSEKFVDGDATSLKVDDLLRTVDSIDKLKPAVRAHLAATARLEIHDKGIPLVKERGAVTTVYYLLCGLCVEHQTNASGQQELIRYITGGECVGDFVGNSIVKRRSSVTVLMRSLFLCVEKADWIMAMKRGNSEAIMIESVSSLPMFSSLPSLTLQQLCELCSDTKVVANEVLCVAHEEPTVVHFIVKGRCSFNLNVPFVKTIKDTVVDLIAPAEFQVEVADTGDSLLWSEVEPRKRRIGIRSSLYG